MKNIYEKVTKCHPSISRGKVWCKTCGRVTKVNPPECLQNGWPKCCGYTMTIDSPEERKQLENEAVERRLTKQGVSTVE